MNCQPRSLCVVVGVVVGLVLSSATRAAAQPVVDIPVFEVREAPPLQPPSSSKPAVEPPNERALIVDVTRGRDSQQELLRELGGHLKRSGITVYDRPLLEADRTCLSPECLQELARREGIGFVLHAQIEETAPSMFGVTMRIFDAVRRAIVQDRATCVQCNQSLLSFKINDMADKLIHDCREARLTTSGQISGASPFPSPFPWQQPIGVSRPPQPTGATPPIKELGYFARLSTTRKVLAAVLGGLAGAALLSSIALTVTNGKDTPLPCEQRMDVLQDKCILRNTPLVASGYVLTGALMVGIGFTLFWPSRKPRTTTPAVTPPISSGTNAAAAMFGVEVR